MRKRRLKAAALKANKKWLAAHAAEQRAYSRFVELKTEYEAEYGSLYSADKE